MSKIEDFNYFNTQGWMLNRLKLKGNELIVFSIINSFSQDKASSFFGSLSYLEAFTGASRPTVIKILKSLCDKGFIERSEFDYHGTKRISYKIGSIVSSYTSKETLPPPSKDFLPPSKETLPPPSKETLPPPSKETLPNNIKEKLKKEYLNSSSAKNDEDELKNSSFFEKNGGLEVVENNRTATAPHTGAPKTSAPVDKLFCDSELADFKVFERYVKSVAEFANAGYYFTRISTWQTKEGFPLRANWYSVVSAWVMDDYRKGKLITTEHKGYEQPIAEQKSASRIEFERMRDEYLNSL